ncbi:Ppx/GppA family phosphatase [Sphingomonas sp. LY160]|uniref:Ppx/GppA family phosphatase n=1 Tax=Sphingomonas sp. LY160 TaxID=3095342 RepID=UPI002ADEBB63|nr:Ppx/GppA family phosphatase [Sphingomonas sp. LY160]MEA1071327.1 Ppx/GppA family phosphatase [Sphingomonas sp. LY160]
MTTTSFGPVGIIDIGSNSVRFVAYGGTPRVPSALFNEKVMAALGRGVAKDGRLDEEAMAKTLAALARFRLLAREMGLKKLHTVATAAVRDASNGPAFMRDIAALGLKPRLLPGPEEAELSGLGVVSAIPRANGIVADLGGGSLELIGVARGSVGEGVSLPIGVLRLGTSPDRAKIAKDIRAAIKDSRLKDAARGHGLYLVGGSFRALAQLDLKSANHPLPIVHQHKIAPERLDELQRLLATSPVEEIKALSGVSASRAPSLAPALTVLQAMVEVLGPRRVMTSAFGLREGLLYRDLPQSIRDEDPLLAGALEVGERLGRFGDHGAALDQWMAPIFPDDPSDMQRLRLATCLLGDIAWNAHPDFRAERAVDMAIHGNWVGISPHGRAVIGRALCSAFGGDGGFGSRLRTLLRPGEEERAMAWGKALRLAQRLSGGTETLLRKTTLSIDSKRLSLTVHARHRNLLTDPVERRLQQLAKAIGRTSNIRIA